MLPTSLGHSGPLSVFVVLVEGLLAARMQPAWGPRDAVGDSCGLPTMGALGCVGQQELEPQSLGSGLCSGAVIALGWG